MRLRIAGNIYNVEIGSDGPTVDGMSAREFVKDRLSKGDFNTVADLALIGQLIITGQVDEDNTILQMRLDMMHAERTKEN